MLSQEPPALGCTLHRSGRPTPRTLIITRVGAMCARESSGSATPIPPGIPPALPLPPATGGCGRTITVRPSDSARVLISRVTWSKSPDRVIGDLATRSAHAASSESSSPHS